MMSSCACADFYSRNSFRLTKKTQNQKNQQKKQQTNKKQQQQQQKNKQTKNPTKSKKPTTKNFSLFTLWLECADLYTDVNVIVFLV